MKGEKLERELALMRERMKGFKIGKIELGGRDRLKGTLEHCRRGETPRPSSCESCGTEGTTQRIVVLPCNGAGNAIK